MIRIEITCARDGCPARVDVVVHANHYFSGRVLKSYVPKGWKVRTPRGHGLIALPYCPVHA